MSTRKVPHIEGIRGNKKKEEKMVCRHDRDGSYTTKMGKGLSRFSSRKKIRYKQIHISSGK